MFNDAVRTQIQAALAFWVAVGDSSRTHPSEHVSVKMLFKLNKTLPLTNDEIENLIFVLHHKTSAVTTISQLAAHLPGVTEHRLRKEVRNLSILSLVRGTGVYALGALLPAVRKIRHG